MHLMVRVVGAGISHIVQHVLARQPVSALERLRRRAEICKDKKERERKDIYRS